MLAAAGLPVSYRAGHGPGCGAMAVDKKARGLRLRLVVLDGLARPGIPDDPPEELLAQAYAGERPMRQVLVLNGPTSAARRPRAEACGTASVAELTAACQQAGRDLGLDVQVRQTDDEAEFRWACGRRCEDPGSC